MARTNRDGKHRDRDETDLVFRKFLRDKALHERGDNERNDRRRSAKESRKSKPAPSSSHDRPAQNSRFDLCNRPSLRDIPVSVSLRESPISGKKCPTSVRSVTLQDADIADTCLASAIVNRNALRSIESNRLQSRVLQTRAVGRVAGASSEEPNVFPRACFQTRRRNPTRSARCPEDLPYPSIAF